MMGTDGWQRLLRGIRDGLLMAMVVAGSAGFTWLLGA